MQTAILIAWLILGWSATFFVIVKINKKCTLIDLIASVWAGLAGPIMWVIVFIVYGKDPVIWEKK